jgi:hypothetical protein
MPPAIFSAEGFSPSGDAAGVLFSCGLFSSAMISSNHVHKAAYF